jgi:trehalose 6-phosphate phosphatase
LPLPPLLLPLTKNPDHSALFLDFDGTLSAIVEDPQAARPLPGVPALLARLAARFGLVAVVSGRPTAFLAESLERPPEVRLVGLYGLELELAPEVAGWWSGVMGDVVMEAVTEAPDGVYVEPKGLTVTIHWRRVPDERPWVSSFAARQEVARGLHVHAGRMELELRPPLDVDKGTVLRLLTGGRAAGWDAVAVFGDDIGDLPAFAAAGELAAARPAMAVVRVAVVDHESSPEVAARADMTVEGAVGAVALLEELAQSVT